MGLLDTTEINSRENPLSEEDKAKEIQGVKDFYKKRFVRGDIDKMGIIKFSRKNPMDIVIVGPLDGETKILKNDGSGFTRVLKQNLCQKTSGVSYQTSRCQR